MTICVSYATTPIAVRAGPRSLSPVSLIGQPYVYTERRNCSYMKNLLASVAVVVVVVLFAFALYQMTLGDYTVAGMSFLSASIVIYYRENHLVEN
jgi:hypothetical protein